MKVLAYKAVGLPGWPLGFPLPFVADLHLLGEGLSLERGFVPDAFTKACLGSWPLVPPSPPRPSVLAGYLQPGQLPRSRENSADKAFMPMQYYAEFLIDMGREGGVCMLASFKGALFQMGKAYFPPEPGKHPEVLEFLVLST